MPLYHQPVTTTPDGDQGGLTPVAFGRAPHILWYVMRLEALERFCCLLPRRHETFVYWTDSISVPHSSLLGERVQHSSQILQLV
jgi:hypothetical protein